MELVVINGASTISKNVLRPMLSNTKISKIKLLDYKPYRQSVYSLQKHAQENNCTIEKHQIQSATQLDIHLEGAEKVLYCTHDYLTMAADKNTFLVGASKLAKKHGVKSMVAVCPIELDMYYNEDERSVWEKKEMAQGEALEAMPKNLTILNTNLFYGVPNYLISYIAKCVYAGRVPYNIIRPDSKFKFRPINNTTIAKAILDELEQNSNQASSKFCLNGSGAFTMQEILHTAEAIIGKEEGSTKLVKPILGGISDFVEEFFVGLAHDKNLAYLSDFFSKHQYLEKKMLEIDYHTQKGGETSDFNTLRTHKLQMENFVLPTFIDYKMTSLD